MPSRKHSLSIFAYPADRGAFVAYFLGAVVPLVALGIVADRIVIEPLVANGDGWHSVVFGRGMLGLVASIAMLSLGCFFMLRRLIHRSLEENRVLAYYDSLTGLPNRLMYRDRLEQALLHAPRFGTLVAIFFVDLDGFKRVNDTLGHGGGDQLLQEVSERLVESVRLSDSVARGGAADTAVPNAAISRHGGDEFTFLLTGIHDARDAGRVARRALTALRKPFAIQGHEVWATASIGIAVAPLDGEDVDTLLHNADAAMYWAKERGRNNYQFYSKAMNHTAERKIVVERRLRLALENDGLTLHYQPVRHAETGAVGAVEALLRWEDSELGSVSPSEFIPVAEDAGLIVAIGAWVLRTACFQARAWQREGFRPIRMAVNVSGHQIRQPEFVASVGQILSESGLSTDHLELEITESTIMQDDEVTDRAFRELDEMGIGLALDDFGTGYSSLAYLRRYSIHRVKIDRSFVAGIPGNPDDLAVTAAIVAMAHNLLLSVVGEGVETLDQAQSLRELGCEELQGFLFSKPVPAQQIERFLEPDKPEADGSAAAD